MRLTLYGLLLIAMGVGSYFLPHGESKYDDHATYTLSRAKHGNWERTPISGQDLNAQLKGAQGINLITSVVVTGAGLAVLGFQWRSKRRG
jgi:hypothetical protein